MRILNENPIPKLKDYDVVLFPMGINNAMYNGFAYEIGLNIPQVRESENKQRYGDKTKCGTIHPTLVDKTIYCACYVHCGGYHKNDDGSFLDYDYLRKCLNEVKERYKNKRILTPVIGHFDADGKGDKEKILKLIEDVCSDCDIDVYDYNEIGSLRFFHRIAYLRLRLKNDEITGDEYIKERSKIEWERTHGMFEPMPEDFVHIPKKEKLSMKFRGRINYQTKYEKNN